MARGDLANNWSSDCGNTELDMRDYKKWVESVLVGKTLVLARDWKNILGW